MNKPKIVIIDYAVGNLFSVYNTCNSIGYTATVTSDIKEILKADAVILPGVGAFGDAMANLDRLGLIPAIKESIDSGKPFLGICLGLQLLFTKSFEFGEHAGLDIIPGSVERFPEQLNGRNIKVPHIGWNKIDIKKESGTFEHVNSGAYVYFVHSYYVKPDDSAIVATTTTYQGVPFCSSIEYENVFATQFHPEKSGKAGIQIYNNWLSSITN